MSQLFIVEEGEKYIPYRSKCKEKKRHCVSPARAGRDPRRGDQPEKDAAAAIL